MPGRDFITVWSVSPDVSTMLCPVLLLLSIVHLSLASDGDCGRYHRSCGLNAHCDEGLKQCVCNSNYTGCAIVECHDPAHYQCVMKADPHLVGYSLPRANLNWPCKYRLTRIQHHLINGTEGLSFCAFEVLGYNKLINGKYFPSGMEIHAAVGDFAKHLFFHRRFKKFNFNQAGVLTGSGLQHAWGSDVASDISGADVFCKFDVQNRFATLDVPRCGFRARFRPYDSSQAGGPQSHVPAISIVVDQDTIFGKTRLGKYGPNLCGQTEAQGDEETLYLDRAAELGLANAHDALLFDALSQLVNQHTPGSEPAALLDAPDQCDAASRAFGQCPSLPARIDAVRLCAPVLTQLTACAGSQALDLFRLCVSASCVDEAEYCGLYSALLASTECGVDDAPDSVTLFCD